MPRTRAAGDVAGSSVEEPRGSSTTRSPSAPTTALAGGAGAPAGARGHQRIGRYRGILRIGHVVELSWLKRLVPITLGVLAIAALVTAIDPAAFRQAIERFRLPLLPAIVALSTGYYVLQGVRWHLLLRDVGIRLHWRDTLLLNTAGQATALLPLGELTRAVFVSEAAGAEFGSVVATVTVQELTYTIVLIAFAAPGLLSVPHALGAVIAALIATAAVFVSLSWCTAYRWLRLVVGHVPILRGFLHEVDELHNDTVLLMHRAGTLTGTWISAVQAAATITSFWLVVQALAPGELTWRSAAMVYALSHLAGALSLVPGGIGAYEASVVGILVGTGINPGVAAAIAVVQRLADKGLATGAGFAAYAVARRRLHVSGLGTLPVRPAEARIAASARAG